MQVTVGAITVTAQATSSPDRHDAQGSGDFYLATNGDIYLAISGDLQLATNGDFHLATDTANHIVLQSICWLVTVSKVVSYRRRRCRIVGATGRIVSHTLTAPAGALPQRVLAKEIAGW